MADTIRWYCCKVQAGARAMDVKSAGARVEPARSCLMASCEGHRDQWRPQWREVKGTDVDLCFIHGEKSASGVAVDGGTPRLYTLA